MTAIIENRAHTEKRAVAVISLAFSADPIARWTYPDPHQYWAYFPRFVSAFAGKAFEHNAVFCTEGFIGAALWMPPGVHPDEEALAEVVQESVADEVQGPLLEMLELQASHHPAEPHWYLPMMGVDPAHQGKGYGSTLLHEALAMVDRDRKLAYLEATNRGSRRLYERHGFEVIAEIQVPGSPPM
jgi:ribosomal protein S18 acetylase RimI-like enzyme